MDGWEPIIRCGCCGEPGYDPVGAHDDLEIRRCVGCGTRRFPAVRPPGEVYDDGYHDGTSEFGWDYGNDDTARYELALANARVRWIERHVVPGPLIDVGGGLGYLSSAAASRGWQPTLIEPVEAACTHASRLPGVDVVHGGWDRLDDFDGDIRLAAFSHSLEHIPEALDALRRARAALQPGGMVYVEVPNYASLARRTQGDSWLGWQPGEHAYLFEPSTLRSLLERAEYDVVACETYVPSWDGLRPDSWAYFLGLDRPLGWATRTAKTVRSLRAASARGAGERVGQQDEEPGAAPVRDLGGARRWLYGRGLPLLDRLERLTGTGIYLRALARRTS